MSRIAKPFERETLGRLVCKENCVLSKHFPKTFLFQVVVGKSIFPSLLQISDFFLDLKSVLSREIFCRCKLDEIIISNVVEKCYLQLQIRELMNFSKLYFISFETQLKEMKWLTFLRNDTIFYFYFRNLNK